MSRLNLRSQHGDGRKMWRKDGFLHREDGPAVLYLDGGEEWLFGGVLHRDGGPATSYKCGFRRWYHHGKLHRTDGPAFLRTCGGYHERGQCLTVGQLAIDRVCWYIHGRQLTEEEFNLYVDQENGEVLIPAGKRLYYDA